MAFGRLPGISGTADVAVVANNGQVRKLPLQLDREFASGERCGIWCHHGKKSPVDLAPDAGNAGFVNALDSPIQSLRSGLIGF